MTTLHAKLFQTVFHIFISDQNVNDKTKRNRNCIFQSLGNAKGRMFDYFFCA